MSDEVGGVDIQSTSSKARKFTDSPKVGPETGEFQTEMEARDVAWLRDMYRPNEPQLTTRALVTGALLGAVLSASDLYIGLKIGWVFGMSITASVLGFAVFRGVSVVSPNTRRFTMLENNTSQTVASAAAYMASAGLVGSIPALTMLRREGIFVGPELTGFTLSLWLFATALLGVVVAVPLKRSLIHEEQLRFPHGVVCAETIRTLHSGEGETDPNNRAANPAANKAKLLLVSGLVAALGKLFLDGRLWIFKNAVDVIGLPGRLRGHALSAWSLGLNTSVLLYAGGAVVGMRIGASVLLGALVNFVVVGPWLLDVGILALPDAATRLDPTRWSAFQQMAVQTHALVVPTPNELHTVLRAKWSVWPGTALMVAASLTSLFLRFAALKRAFASIGKLFRVGKSTQTDVLAEVEVPSSWFLVGLLVAGTLCVVLQSVLFAVPWYFGVISVLAALALSIVAARASGETGVTPISALGKITQLLFGVLMPGNVQANLMTATVTAGASAHAADLLTEVKTGYLLGASARRQFVAQIVGVAVGSLACVPLYFLLATPERLGKELAAPGAVAWASVAKLLKDGVGNLPRYALAASCVAVVLGIVMSVIEDRLPEAKRQYLPSATAIGIALVIDGNDAFAIFLGALIAWALRRYVAEFAERAIVPVASGAIAGEGLMGILVIVLRDVLHVLPAK